MGRKGEEGKGQKKDIGGVKGLLRKLPGEAGTVYYVRTRWPRNETFERRRNNEVLEGHGS